MKDIAPELLKLIEDDFKEAYEKSYTIRKKLYDIDRGRATYKEVNEYAEEVGELLAKAFQKHLSSDVLPDGRMYYNIAERVIRTPLENNYKLVSKVCAEVQTNLNKQVGLGLKGIPPKINKDRIRGLIDKVSDAEEFDKVKKLLDESVVNFTMSVVDDAVKENAEFQFMSGLAPKIKRTSTGHCCEWCEKLVGTYNYEDVRDTGNDVFRRHRHCRCTVEFITNGKRQNVHTKRWKKYDDTVIINTQEKKPRVLHKEDILTSKFKRGSGKNYPVRFIGSDHCKFDSDIISRVTVIAGKNVKSDIRVAKFLEGKYQEPAAQWEKISGITHIRYKGNTLKVEIHWFESNDKRVDIKVKRVIKDES